MGCLSSKQKSLNFSSCSGQTSPTTAVGFLFLKDSQSALNARLLVGSSWEHSLRQTGHCGTSWVLQKRWRHSSHKLWLHFRVTGSVKISQQMIHVKSSSRKDKASAMTSVSFQPIEDSAALLIKLSTFTYLLEVRLNLLYLSPPHPTLSFLLVNFRLRRRFINSSLKDVILQRTMRKWSHSVAAPAQHEQVFLKLEHTFYI